MSVLAVEKLDVRHGLLQAVRDVRVSVARGETLALLGANGAGKTTLLRAIAGAHLPAGGRILLGNDDITQVPSAAKGGARKPVLPKSLPERITTIRGLLADQPKPALVEELARSFQRVPRDDVQEVLNALVALGLARRLDDHRYAP